MWKLIKGCTLLVLLSVILIFSSDGFALENKVDDIVNNERQINANIAEKSSSHTKNFFRAIAEWRIYRADKGGSTKLYSSDRFSSSSSARADALRNCNEENEVGCAIIHDISGEQCILGLIDTETHTIQLIKGATKAGTVAKGKERCEESSGTVCEMSLFVCANSKKVVSTTVEKPFKAIALHVSTDGKIEQQIVGSGISIPKARENALERCKKINPTGCSSNHVIAGQECALITHLNSTILVGSTREMVMALCEEEPSEVCESRTPICVD